MKNYLENKPTVDVKIEQRALTRGENIGKGHIKIWVTYKERVGLQKKWPQVPYKTGLFCKLEEFERIIDPAVKDRHLSTLLLDIRKKVNALRARANFIIDELGISDRKNFELHFLSGQGLDEIDGEFNVKIQELEAANRISSAEKYLTALRSMKEFFQLGSSEPVPVTYSMCTPDKLQAYEDWYTGPKKKGSLTSVGINMRCFRHVFKRAMKKGIASERDYPFGTGGYLIPEGGDETKKFLESEDKARFVSWRHAQDEAAITAVKQSYQIVFRTRALEEQQDFRQWPNARKDELFDRYAMEVIDGRNEMHDYALFSYYGNGMNMSDLARLTRDRVFKEYLTINRQKTKLGKKKKNKVTAIPIHPVMREIIQRRGKKSLVPGDYVFPILEYGSSEQEIFYRIRKLVDKVNEVLAIIYKELGLEIQPTSYTLRHTFSFHFMQQEGATTEDLQDALAHGSVKTTEAYKHGFSMDRKKKFSGGL